MISSLVRERERERERRQYKKQLTCKHGIRSLFLLVEKYLLLNIHADVHMLYM
jgi:hypothetical protein